MLRAVYDFQAPYENTLTFAENELFIVLKRNNKDTNWVHVISLNGVSGYAPANYLTVANCTTTEELEHVDRVLNFVTCSKKPAPSHKIVIESLQETRSKLEKELDNLGAKHVYEMACIVRQNTKCTFQEAQSSSLATIEYFRRNVFPVPGTLQRMMKVDLGQIPLEIRRNCDDSHELNRLVQIIMETASDQDTDVPQYVWDNFLELITHADPVLCIDALERYDCCMIFRLVQRLQAETCWLKRKPILQILFHGLLLMATFQNVALNSVLPSDLVRDIQAGYTGHGTNKERVYWSVRVLTVTLCSKERLSFVQLNDFGQQFINLLIEILETESVSIATITTEGNDDMDLSKAVLDLILAIHYQFQMCLSEDNTLLLVLASPVKCFSLVENMIRLYNREEDPLQDYMDGEGTDSVSSLIIASFSTRQISTNMYCGGDLEVLLDVISRRLADYGHGDQRRTDALKLFHAIRKQCPDCLVRYRLLDFQKSLKNICDESQRLGLANSSMDQDRILVLKIVHEFPELLTTSS